MPSNQLMEAARMGAHWLLVPLLAVLIILWPTLSSGLDQLQTDPGDTLLNHYFLEHAYQHLRDGQLMNPDHFWSPDYFWPIKDTLAWSDHLIGPAVLYGLIRTIVQDPYQAYVGWLILTLCLNYIALRKALLTISPRSTSSWLSLIALITAFSPAITMQLGHPQLLSLFLIGPILVLCHRLLNEQDTTAFSLGNWLTLGFYLLSNGIFNIYIFVYGCYGALMCALIHIIRRVKASQFGIRAGHHWARSASWLLAVVAANALIYRPYLDSLNTFGERPIKEIIGNLPKPASWLFSRNHWLLPPPLRDGQTPQDWVSGAEQHLFPGWLFLILLIGAVITALRVPSRQDKDLRRWLLAIGAMLIGCISFMDLSFWPLISKLLPGAGSLRASSRIGIVIILFTGPCLALASTHWIQARTLSARVITALVGFTAAFCSIWAIGQPSFSLSQWKEKHLSISEALLANDCELFWQEWPTEERESWRAHVQAMHIQQRTGIPTLNGLSGQFPKHDWPYNKPSGDGAYAWVALNNPGEHHRLRDQPDSLKRCVATWDPKSGSTEIRNIQMRNGMPVNLSATFNPSRSIYKDNGIEISSDDNNRLFARFSNDADPKTEKNWILLTRDGRPIPSIRGDYMITGARLDDDQLLVDDTNNVENIQYTWRIKAKNGVFIDQTMTLLEN